MNSDNEYKGNFFIYLSVIVVISKRINCRKRKKLADI
jgi:hypothetical protein